MSDSVTATYKVGTNKGRPRIWIDGRRLADAVFAGGIEYWCTVQCEDADFRGSAFSGRIECAITTVLPVLEGRYSHRKRRVTGRPGGKPIIDLLGRDVEAAFPGASRVRATFSPGKIVIEREE